MEHLTDQLDERGIRWKRIGPCLLICGDCLEVLPLLEPGSVDVTVSSPPYNMISKTTPSGLMRNAPRKKNAGYESHSDNMPTEQYERWVRNVFSECVRASRGIVWVNHKTKYEGRCGRHPARIYPWPIFCEVIWDTAGSLTLNANRYAPSHESIFGFGVPHFWDRRNDTLLSVWRIMQERTIDGHPCPFPVEIPARLIESSCPKCGTVSDPFMGSGTTGVACIKTGREFIGIEIEPKYFDIACKRIRRAWRDKCSELPFEPEPKMVQRTLEAE